MSGFTLSITWMWTSRCRCNFFRKIIGAFGLNATRYHKGCVRSLLSRDKVAASLLGCRAIFSRIAEYG